MAKAKIAPKKEAPKKVTKKIAPKASVKVAPKKVAPEKPVEDVEKVTVADGVKKIAEPKAAKPAKPKKEAKPLLPLGDFENVKILKATSDEKSIFCEFEVPTSDGTFIERHVGKGDNKKSFYGNVTHDLEKKETMTLINRYNDLTKTQQGVVRKFGRSYIANIKSAQREAAKAEREKKAAEKKAAPKVKDVSDKEKAAPKVAPKKAIVKAKTAKISPKKKVVK